MANRLAQETSPYLLQHRDNPVDWYPWGEEALARAREEDRPILLSVGYSACHWCHVMERESFEDPETAAYMNEHFVNVKVDREERPDVDAIYMEAVQAISGHGGWPMTVFLDPDGVPFYGGTYFPPDESRGMPSFRMVMEAVVDAFETPARGDPRAGAETRGAARRDRRRSSPPRAAGGGRCSRRRSQRLLAAADRERGGFGGAPKFPPASALELLLARGETEARRADPRRDDGRRHLRPARRRLRPLLGRRGLARPPLREDALRQRPAGPRLPARLAGARPRALPPRLRGDARLDAARDARPRGRLLLGPRRRLRGRGGQLLRLDPGEIREVLARRDADSARSGIDAFYGVTRAGQLRGREHPAPRRRRRAPPEPEGLAEMRRALLEARAQAGPARARRQAARPPGTRWRSPPWPTPAPSSAARTTSTPPAPAPSSSSTRCATTTAACCAPTRTAAPTSTPTSRTTPSCSRRCWRSTRRPSSRAGSSEARALAETMIERFGDPERGGFFSTAGDHEELIARRKEVGDHPIPSGNSAAAMGLLRLAALTGERRYEAAGRGRLRPLRQTGRPAPRRLRPPPESPRLPPLPHQRGRPGRRRPRPSWPRSSAAPATPPPGPRRRPRGHRLSRPSSQDRTTVDGRPAAYVCENFTCQLPVTDPEKLLGEFEPAESGLDSPIARESVGSSRSRTA